MNNTPFLAKLHLLRSTLSNVDEIILINDVTDNKMILGYKQIKKTVWKEAV